MPNLRLVKAALTVTRHLSPLERGTIIVALRVLQLAEPTNQQLAWARSDMTIDEILNDEGIGSMIVELSDAQEVKVCRRKP